MSTSSQTEAPSDYGSEMHVRAPFGARIVRVTGREDYGAYVVLRAADATGPVPRAGQFYMVSAWASGEAGRPFLPRAFSALRARPCAPAGVELQFLLEDVGPGTHRLCDLRSADELTVVGPLGNGFRPPPDGERPLLVGGGVGIAPLAIWQDQLAAEAPALLGFRTAAHARGADLLSRVTVATDDGSVGHPGYVTELLEAELEAADEPVTVYACGPEAMLEVVRRRCAARGTSAQLALETGMACGYGACFGCVVSTRHGYLRLCVDGPVLDAALLEGCA
jgi:NAD(P)H-flavin reductase